MTDIFYAQFGDQISFILYLFAQYVRGYNSKSSQLIPQFVWHFGPLKLIQFGLQSLSLDHQPMSVHNVLDPDLILKEKEAAAEEAAEEEPD